MDKIVVIKGDYNDADYVTEISYIRDEKTEELMSRFIEGLLCFVSPSYYNWFGSDYTSENTEVRKAWLEIFTEEELDTIAGYCPYHENGVHSIESVAIITGTVEGSL